MSALYRHRANRRLHLVRHGWRHVNLHRRGVRHRHGSRQGHERPEAAPGGWRTAPRRLLSKELGRQIILGAVIGVVGLVAVCALLGFLALEHARGDLTKAQNIAKDIADHRTMLLTPSGRAEASTDLASMHYYAAQANSELSGSLPLSVLKEIPVIGYQVDSLTGSVNAVDVLATQGQQLMAAAITTIDASHGTSINLPKLKALDAQVHASAGVLGRLITSSAGLWGPVQSERVKLNAVLTTVEDLLNRGGDALNFAQPFLGADGPRTYLVAGENNSEMRDQGAVLSWALLHVDDGTFTMTSAASVGTITLSSPAAPITAASTETAFGDLDPTRIWQSVNANGNFPTSARWMIAMFRQARGITVNGVIGVDVETLTKILRVTGPVHVRQIHQRVTAANVAPLLLFKLYLKYPAGSQVTRHDDITAVAQAAVDKMKRGHYDLGAFFDALAKASNGRHLLFYDTDAPLEHAVESFGGSGALLADTPNVAHLAIEAGVAAKLDWFIHTKVTYDIRLDSHGTAYYTVTVLMHNDAPADAKPSYAMGPDHTNSFTAGEYIGRLYLWLPAGSQAPGALSEEGLSLERADQPVYAQQTQEVVFTATELNAVKHGVFSLQFVPQSLIHPSMVTVNFSAPGNYTGPTNQSWVADHFVTLTWKTS